MNASTLAAPRTTTPSTTAAREPMRALLQSRYGSAEVLRTGTTARPVPGAGEVLVKVHAAGIDRGTWHMLTGRPYMMRVMGFGFRGPKSPVPGLDLAGTVVEVGPGVSRFAVGDAVFGIGEGAFAEYARAREDKLVAKPAGLSFEQAAVLGVSGGTALQALALGQLKAGEKVLVIGASGGVGTFVVQLARALGAEVTGVSSAAKADLVRRLGAHHVLAHDRGDFADGSVRYDLVLDLGGNTPLARLRRAMTPTGRLVFVGGELGGDWTGGFGRQLGALLLGLFVKQRFAMLASKEHFSHLVPLAAACEKGELIPAVERTVSLAEVPQVLRDMEAGRVRGKTAVVLG